MKERQRWTSEEDAILGAYVRQYGAREWHLLPQRMNVTIDRDAKSCLERWKNYLKPGIKRGSLTEEEQRLVICLQAKHGNKWKRIASEVPGRTAKRLGKWWEVYKEKLERAKKESTKSLEPVEEGKYDRILETFAEKLVKEIDSNRPTPSGFLMGMSNGGFLHGDQVHPALPQTQMLPPWLSASTAGPPLSPSTSPSVTLSLASATAPNSVPWLRPERVPAPVDNGGEQMMLVSELMCCCRELEEGHRALSAHKKEAAWRLNRVELQLEAEKASRRREKAEEIEAKIRALKEEEKVSFERIEAEYREQLAALRRDAEIKEQKLADRWSAKHMRITNLLEQISHRNRLSEQN